MESRTISKTALGLVIGCVVSGVVGLSARGGPYVATVIPAVGGSPGETRMAIVDDKIPVSRGTGEYVEAEDYANIAAGAERCEIEGVKFHDLNGNGIREAGEAGLEGWKIYIDLNKNGKFDIGEQNTITGPSGHYEFRDLEPGSYVVAEVPKGGWVQTLPGWMGGRIFGSEKLKGDVDATRIVEIDRNNGNVINSFLVPQGTYLFGGGDIATGPTSIFFINDLITGPKEITLGIWELEADTGAVIDYDEWVPETLQLDLGAAYLDGKVYIALGELPFPVTEIDIIAWDPVVDEVTGRVTVGEQMGDGMAANPESGELLITDGFDKVARVDPSTGSILGTVGHNAIPCVLMAYVEGKIIRTKWSSPFTTYVINPNNGDIVDSYEITGVGSLDGMGGDGQWTERYKVTLEAGEVLELDFGNVGSNSGKIHGVKWEDVNGDGVRDVNEPGIVGWGIYLDDNGNGVADVGEHSTVTDVNGVYEFTGLEAGSYVVAEVARCNWRRTGPWPVSTELIDVNKPCDVVFDRARNMLYIGTAGGTVERYDLGAGELLSPFAVGTSPFGMDITPDGSALYVTEGQTADGKGVLHKVDLESGVVANISYGLEKGEGGGWDIKIGSNGKGLLSLQDDGWAEAYLRQIDTGTDVVSIRGDVHGVLGGRINVGSRIYRSADRSGMWVIGAASHGWNLVYDSASDSFVKEFAKNMGQIPFALNRNAKLIGVQRYLESFKVWTNNNEPVTAFEESKGGAVFDAVNDRLYMVQSEGDQVVGVDSKSSSRLFSVPAIEDIPEFVPFTNGETAVGGDGRFIALTVPSGVFLINIGHRLKVTPGRTFRDIDFGNNRNTAGDFDGDDDVDAGDLAIFCSGWLRDDFCTNIVPCEGDSIVDLKDFAAVAGNWHWEASPFMEFDEDFETGDFSKYPWTHEGQAPWKVVSREAFEGQYCAQSDERLGRYTETALKVTLSVEAGEIKFFCKTGSRGGRLKFYVDDGLYGSWDYGEDWALQSFRVAAGNHTFKWEYGTGVFGDMCAWVDGIRFPPISEQ